MERFFKPPVSSTQAKLRVVQN